MVSKYRDILEPPAEVQLRSSPVMQRATPTQQGNVKEWKCFHYVFFFVIIIS